MLKHFLGTILLLCAFQATDTSPYIDGNQFNSYYTNPNLISTFLNQINATVSPACSTIPGIGLPILAIKQVLQNIDSSLAFGNNNTAAKIIFMKEKKNNTTFQTTYKLVAQIKSFSTNNYIAVEGVYKQVGYPAFEVTTYYLDSDLDNIKSILGEFSIDANAYVGCGDVKSIFTQDNPNKAGYNIMPVPYSNGKLVNTAPTSNNANGSVAKNDVDPAVIASIIKLLQKSN